LARIKIFRNGAFPKETEIPDGTALYGAVSAAGVYLDAPCGGAGRCGKCLVRLTRDGELVKACRTYAEGDMEVWLPDEGEMKIAAEKAVSGAGHTGPYAAAVDIGTTTVAVHITDIPTGAVIGAAAGANVQRGYGSDVISRILYCAENGHDTLTELIRGQVASLTSQAARAAGLESSDITYLVIVGNTIMQHLYNGDSPVGMGTVPFTPVSLYGDESAADARLGLAPGAVQYLAPCVHSYVGGDITAGILSSGLLEAEGTMLLLDVGTNGEMALKCGDEIFCCATAAGPAFEGAEISCGMPAMTGAVNRASFSDGGFEFEVIGGGEPKGICGSGLVDVLALLLSVGAVDEGGLLLPADEAPEAVRPYLDEVDGMTVFRIGDEVYISASDVRKLQLAKAAIAAGISALLSRSGRKTADGLILAGGFGSYMDVRSAARIGLFPKELLPNVRAAGNTAGAGAVMAACSPEYRELLRDIAERCEYVELSTDKVFNEQFVEQMMFDEENLEEGGI